MAKSLRSKAKRRLRTVRREHHWDTRGKDDLLKIASRLHNPFYDLRGEFAPRVNAFVEPSNPDAVFPQIAKPDILDFRSHKMAKGGYAATNTFRKHLSEKTTKSKYTSVVKTREELDKEEADAQFEDVEDEELVEEEVLPKAKKSKATIDDIVQLSSKLTLSKKKKEVAVESKPI
jgi:hypothetical protein